MGSGGQPWGEEILRSIDERLERLDRQAEAGSVFAAEARDELRLTRLAYGQQLELTREVIDRTAESHAGMMQALADLRAEVRAQTAAIFRMLDRLDGGTSPA